MNEVNSSNPRDVPADRVIAVQFVTVHFNCVTFAEEENDHAER